MVRNREAINSRGAGCFSLCELSNTSVGTHLGAYAFLAKQNRAQNSNLQLELTLINIRGKRKLEQSLE